MSFVLKMLGNAGEGFAPAKYASFFSLFDPDGIIAGAASAYWGMAVLLAGAAVLFAAAVTVFSKRDMHV